MGYVCVGYVWNGYVWDMCNVLDMCGICVVDTFEMDMCGICKMCWICVGYVWCEIRQQSSEEPCDETSFGKKFHVAILLPFILRIEAGGKKLLRKLPQRKIGCPRWSAEMPNKREREGRQ